MESPEYVNEQKRLIDQVRYENEQALADPDSVLSKVAICRLLSQSMVKLRNSTNPKDVRSYLTTADLLSKISGFTKATLELTTTDDFIKKLEEREKNGK